MHSEILLLNNLKYRREIVKILNVFCLIDGTIEQRYHWLTINKKTPLNRVLNLSRQLVISTAVERYIAGCKI